MTPDIINHPPHYAGLPASVECIDITRHLPFSLGNAVKYLWRAGKKGGSKHKQAEDLRKAVWYIRDFIDHPIKFDSSAAIAVASLIKVDQQDDCMWSIINSTNLLYLIMSIDKDIASIETSPEYLAEKMTEAS